MAIVNLWEYQWGVVETEFFGKFKKIFKKEDIKTTATESTKQKESPVRRYTRFIGDGPVFDALRYGADKFNQMVEAGAIRLSRAKAFIGVLKSIEVEQVSDDVKLAEISQTIGGIINS